MATPMITGINNEDRLVQQTFADHLHDRLGWDSVYAYNDETFGPAGTLGRGNEREIILTRDLRAAIQKLNSELPPAAVEDAIQTLTTYDYSRSTLQHKAQTQAEVKTLILDQLYAALPSPPFTEQETDDAAARIYDYVFQRCAAGMPLANVA